MKVHQFEDKYLAHYSYAILSECERKVVLIDPGRNPQQYYAFAGEHQAEIIAVIETHSHADFISSHLEISTATGATIYASKKIGASYPILNFDQGDELAFGKIVLKSLNTPGHSDDSISVILEHEGKPKYLFSGDTLFIGDCGRPDLREADSNAEMQREKLAAKMYASLREKIMLLPDDVILYPAHGSGTLCGKDLSDASSSTIGEQKQTNWSLAKMSEADFIKELTSDQPFIPAYFPYDVDLNKEGAGIFQASVDGVSRELLTESALSPDAFVVDTRDQQAYKESHFPHSINIMDGAKFETWLGSMILPDEQYYLVSDSAQTLDRLIERTASIGYETKIKSAFLVEMGSKKTLALDKDHFRNHPEDYTIIDVRNPAEVLQNPIFKNAITIPLADIRGKINTIPSDKPIAVHCASGYRSAIGSSLIASLLPAQRLVYDIGEFIKEFSDQTSE